MEQHETKRTSSRPAGVSIITCTKRRHYIHRIFNNYAKQKVSPKELIIVLNNNQMDIEEYKAKAKHYSNVYIYQLPERTSLGACLNYAIDKCRHRYIAKFDDDDYYSPWYLSESIRAFRRTGADVVGKHGHFLYLSGKKLLVGRFLNGENKFVTSVSGATFVIHRRVFRMVRFRNQQVGEDDRFCEDCIKRGLKIYATSRFNFVGIRRPQRSTHTWKISDSRLLSLSNVKKVAYTENYKSLTTKRFL